MIPSLSIGALAVANGVVLAGTGDTNDATDSYYGGGHPAFGRRRHSPGRSCRTSTDGAAGNHTLRRAWASRSSRSHRPTPSLVVAAASTAAEGARGECAERGLSRESRACTTRPTPACRGISAPSWPTATSPCSRSSFGLKRRDRGGVEPRSPGLLRRRAVSTATTASPDGINVELAWPGSPAPASPLQACPSARRKQRMPHLFAARLLCRLSRAICLPSQSTPPIATPASTRMCARSPGSSCANATVQFGSRLVSPPRSRPAAAARPSRRAATTWRLPRCRHAKRHDSSTPARSIFTAARSRVAASCATPRTPRTAASTRPASRLPSMRFAVGPAPLLYLGNDGGVYRSRRWRGRKPARHARPRTPRTSTT